jgi:hypothetical protein
MLTGRLRHRLGLAHVLGVAVAPAASGGDTSSGGKSGASGSGGTSGGASGNGGSSGTAGEGGAPPEGGTGGTAGDTGGSTSGSSGTAGTAGCSAPTTFYRDADEDTYGDDAVTEDACEAPTGYVDRGGDCADDDDTRNPGATERCNGLDENCDDPDEGSTCPAGCVPQDIMGVLHLLCAGPVNWGTAKTTCEDERMVLARIRNSSESLAIRNAMNTAHATAEYWLGGSDGPAPADEGTWRWLAGGGDIFWPSTGIYTNWAMDEPATTFPAQDCLKALMGQWHAEQCQLTFAFVCEALP